MPSKWKRFASLHKYESSVQMSRFHFALHSRHSYHMLVFICIWFNQFHSVYHSFIQILLWIRGYVLGYWKRKSFVLFWKWNDIQRKPSIFIDFHFCHCNEIHSWMLERCLSPCTLCAAQSIDTRIHTWMIVSDFVAVSFLLKMQLIPCAKLTYECRIAQEKKNNFRMRPI